MLIKKRAKRAKRSGHITLYFYDEFNDIKTNILRHVKTKHHQNMVNTNDTNKPTK
jgi:hypothetical protein